MSTSISKYVSYNEVIRSNTAKRKHINNIPNQLQLDRIITLSKKVFDPLRVWCGGKVRINSVFRSKALNRKIGGVKSSQHLANRGAAMDIDDIYGHKTNLEMGDYIKDNLEFDQLIYEFPVNGNPAWIHVSYNEGKNRGNVMISIKTLQSNGKEKTEYLFHDGNEGLLKIY